MAHLIEVAFKGNRKEFFLWEADEAPPLKAGVIVEADRGEDLGHVHAVGELARLRAAGCTHGLAGAEPTKRALRLATREDEARAAELRAQDETTRRRAMERVKANGLVMKLSDAEWQWDRKKLTLYFTAEKRVDFRQLVRDLAAMFRTRIELKQIGVRDEARRLDGIGRCGRQYCSASWLPDLRPVNLGVAKDQRLSLNPSQISGACGRLMCCLRYEHEFYVQSRKRFPKEGKILATSRGEEKVVANDIFKERVTLRTVEGEMRTVLLADLRREIAEHDAAAAGALELAESAADAHESGDDAEGEGMVAEGGAQAQRGRARRPLPTLDRGGRGAPGGAPRGERPRPPRRDERPGEAQSPAATGGSGGNGGATNGATSGAQDEHASPELAPVGAGPGAGEQGGEETEGERRARRRRGRRGGRRGRGGDRERSAPGEGASQTSDEGEGD